MATTLWLCMDCRDWAHGISEDERGETFPQAVIDAFMDPARSLGDITPGTLEHDCDRWDEETQTLDGSMECDCEHVTFTWNRCDGCLSPLGGEREAFTLWD